MTFQSDLYIFVIDNEIGADGARALAESLKQNTTLTQLNLEGMSAKPMLLYERRSLNDFSI